MEIDRNSPNQRPAARNAVNRYNFLGKETQVATGYIDLSRRFFDPAIGRFMQVDPVTDTQENYSTYQYGWNNPILRSDPYGDCPLCPAIPYLVPALAEGLAVVTEVVVASGALAVMKEGIMSAGADAGLYSPATGAAMSLSKPGELTGGNRNANDSKGDAAAGGNPDKGNKLSKSEERAAKLSEKDKPGQPMTRAGKSAVIDVNMEKNSGKTICKDCGTTTVPAKQSQRGVTPPSNETNVDHVVPRSKGGSGTPSNGEVRCRDKCLCSC